MINLLGRRSSINVQKVSWTLHEIGLDFAHEEIGGRFGGLNTDRFLSLNPNGRIPVLSDGETVVWDSHAVVRYLCAQYSPGALWQVEPADRAQSDRWMEWCATTLQPAFMGFFWAWYRTPEAERDERLCSTLLAQSHAAFGLAEQYLARWEARSLTMAGLVIATQLHRYFTLDIDRPDLPNLEAWYAALSNRQAYRAGVMVPYDELKGRLAF